MLARLPLAVCGRPRSLCDVTDRLREQLQTTFGARYTIDRELGGGSMSRVFVARSYSAQFRFNDALRAVNRALALDSNATLAWTRKYEILTALGQVAGADTR